MGLAAGSSVSSWYSAWYSDSDIDSDSDFDFAGSFRGLGLGYSTDLVDRLYLVSLSLCQSSLVDFRTVLGRNSSPRPQLC